MIDKFLNKLKKYAINEPYIESVIMVGSYARGTNTPNSDLDLCIITTNKKEMVHKSDFIGKFGEYEKIQTEYYGPCTSIRVWYKNGPEVEFGIVEPSWISLPLDSGTYQVLCGGYKVIVDKSGYFKELRNEI